MSRGATRRRIAAALVLTLVLATALLAPAIVRRSIVRNLAERGVTASVHLSLGGVRLDDLSLSRQGIGLACDHLLARPDFGATLEAHEPRLRGVVGQGCAATGELAELEQGTEHGSAPAPETWGATSTAALLGDLSLDVLDVDVVVRGNAVRGRLTDVSGRADGAAPLRARVASEAPVPWQGSVTIRTSPSGVAVSPDAPLVIDGWTLGVDELSVGRGHVVGASGMTVDGPDGVAFHLDRLRFDGVRVEASGLRAELPRGATEPATETGEEEGSGRAESAALGEAAIPASVPDEPPPAWATDALRALARLPAARLDLADELAAGVDRLPFPLSIIDAEVGGVPVCGRVRVGTASVASSGIEAELECGGWRVSGSVPRDADAPVVLRMVGFELSALSDDADGRVDLDAVLERAEDGGLSVRIDARATGVRFAHPAISTEPIEDAAATAHVEFDIAASDELPAMAARWTATVGDVGLDGELAAEPDGDTWRLRGEGGVAEPTPCEAMWRAVPHGLAPRLHDAGVTFEGEARPRFRASYTAGDPESFDVRQDGFMGDCRIVDIGAPFDPRELLLDTYVHTVTEHVTLPIQVGPGAPGYVPLDSVPSFVPALMWLSEEIAFFENPGFSLMLMRRAVRIDIREGRYVYGGSTVSQQLVKNLYFERDKTLARKLEEAIVVWAMEQWVPKERILELYLNCIEFAPDVWGIKAASDHYFGLDPAALTPIEAAFLAALKPAPWQGERYRGRGHSPETGWWQDRLRVLLQRLVDEGPYIEQSEVDHYAPYVVTFPPEDEDEGAWVRAARPKGAMTETLVEARTRLGLPSPVREPVVFPDAAED